MKEIIIFCQAPADIQYALTIYERSKNDSEVSFYCVNVKGIYNFINKLNLNIKELVFIPYDFELQIKNPASIITLRNKFDLLFQKYFKNIKNSKIYFFSHLYDYMTFSFINKLSGENNIYFINHYDDAIIRTLDQPPKNIKTFIIKNIYKLITGINFSFYASRTGMVVKYDFQKDDIIEIKNNILDHNVFSKYSFKVAGRAGKKVLFLEADYRNSNDFIEYKKTSTQIMQMLINKEYSIYLKPHPRLGYSMFLKDLVHFILDADIPAEFIDVECFDLIVGLSSISLANCANQGTVKTISLINLYNYRDDKIKKKNLDYLHENSENICFVNNIRSFEDEIIINGKIRQHKC